MKFDRETENLIANLRGFPEDKRRSIVRSAMPIENLVEVVMERYRLNQPRIEDIIMRKWREIVGDRTSHRCSPRRIVQGKKLLVFAANSTVRSELSFKQKEILRKINALPGCESIQAIQFISG